MKLIKGLDYEFLDMTLKEIDSLKEALFHAAKENREITIDSNLEEMVLHTRTSLAHIKEIEGVNPPALAAKLKLISNSLNVLSQNASLYKVSIDEFHTINTAYSVIRGVAQSVNLNQLLNRMDDAMTGIGTTVAFLRIKANEKEPFCVDWRMMDMIHDTTASIDMLQRKTKEDYQNMLTSLIELREKFKEVARDPMNYQDLCTIKIEQVEVIEEAERVISKFFYENDENYIPILPEIPELKDLE